MNSLECRRWISQVPCRRRKERPCEARRPTGGGSPSRQIDPSTIRSPGCSSTGLARHPISRRSSIPRGRNGRPCPGGKPVTGFARSPAGLLSLGLAPEERCAIFSSTRVEWILADLGILCAGGATTTIYPANSEDDCIFILRDSEAAYVFVEDPVLLTKLASHRAELPNVRKIILFDGPGGEDGWAIRLAALESRGRAHDAAHPVQYEAEVNDALQMIGPGDLQYFWLPLAHVFGKVLEAAQIHIGFPTAVDGRVERLVGNLKAIRPTFICAVPRIFEKVHNKVLAQAQAAGGLKHKLFLWALGVGTKVSKLRQAGKEPGGLLAVSAAAADALVFRKVRKTFGGRVRFFISGSAPLARDLGSSSMRSAS